jgi:Glutamyl-tRNAGlu reductase, N-terminal domain
MAYRSLRDTSAAVVMPLRFIARNWGSGHDTAMTHGPHGTLAFGSMELRVLNVLQWRGAHAATAAAPEADCGQDLFLIDTCQRRVAVMFGSEKLEPARRQFPADGALEHFEGAGAYAFLLRFCCGLESKLVAESEIFGQIKQAWRDFSGRGSPLAKQLSPWIQPLFQDAKEIRAQYLGSLGSVSYGSQVRRLLGEEVDSGPTLLVGAGQLAQAVAPWLTGSELWLWNRTATRARELALELAKRSPERPVRVIAEGAEAELTAWRGAHQVVICVPPERQADQARVAAWRERLDGGGRIIHLGAGAEGAAPWSNLPEFVSLGALFGMLQAHSEVRRRQLERSRAACLEKALLRALGANSSHPHSWEDLAAFNAV